jgi:hypothetical protein
MNFDDFKRLVFEPRVEGKHSFVYILCCFLEGKEMPFYVGQTGRPWARLDDYWWAKFYACTDFRVGEAIRSFDSLGFQIIVFSKPVSNSALEERSIIQDLKLNHHRLLNDEPAYDYKTANEIEERQKVHDFVEGWLATRGMNSRKTDAPSSPELS